MYIPEYFLRIDSDEEVIIILQVTLSELMANIPPEYNVNRSQQMYK